MSKQYLDTWNGVPVYTDYLPIGTRRCGEKLVGGRPKFAVFHDTGNRDSTAQQNVNYYKNTYNIDWSVTASAHIFVDDKEAIICIPIDEKAWHVLYDTPIDNAWYGDDANDIAFGLEASYFSNRERSLKSLDNSCRIMAALCKSWDINPRNQMPGHQQIQADKQDPGNILEACGYGRQRMDIIDNLVIKFMNDGSITQDTWEWKGKFTTFKSNKEPIVVRRSAGLNGQEVTRDSWINPDEYVKFDQVIKRDGYWWVRFKYESNPSAGHFYAPIGKITDKDEKLLKEKNLWGNLEVYSK